MHISCCCVVLPRLALQPAPSITFLDAYPPDLLVMNADRPAALAEVLNTCKGGHL